jgi:hypothetical protein
MDHLTRQGGCGGIVSAVLIAIVLGLWWLTSADAAGLDQPITLGAVLGFIGIVGGIFAVAGLCLFVLWLFNPFRTGH